MSISPKVFGRKLECDGEKDGLVRDGGTGETREYGEDREEQGLVKVPGSFDMTWVTMSSFSGLSEFYSRVPLGTSVPVERVQCLSL